MIAEQKNACDSRKKSAHAAPLMFAALAKKSTVAGHVSVCAETTAFEILGFGPDHKHLASSRRFASDPSAGHASKKTATGPRSQSSGVGHGG
mmetsp:Transcript_67937/g.189756  ORF Transcript_67937/g.189756 Transcript_67937/m.189756 type:complete len:92 (-) Transcript_67937:2324-2599(-)